MSHQFSRVPTATIPRSSFNRSHTVKTTFDAGLLIPIFLDEVLPGDTFNLRANLFGRMATPIAPLMDNLYLETFFFFVPNRLVWDNWAKFNGEQDSPGDSTDYTIPVVQQLSQGATTGTIPDYFGIPINADGYNMSALPYRSYNLIYNEWFRDQNLCLPRPVQTDDGPDTLNTHEYISPARRGKRHDYFTSCLPWPQKGDPVTVPLGDKAPIYADPTTQGDELWFNQSQTGTNQTSWQSDGSTQQVEIGGLTQAGAPNVYADLASATGFTINELRQSFQIQKLLERDARGGTRYTEIVRSHFGVTSPDARLQRPEFLGGGTSMISVNPVASTAQVSGGAANLPPPTSGILDAKGNVGGLGAFATVSAQGHGFTKSFTEHGHIIGFANVRADLTYQQGLNRMWTRSTRYDFYWPALAHIGEQEVKNSEVYLQGVTILDDGTFGYQERSAEYRYANSLITGDFRSAASGTLDYWHLAQDFADLPTLSQEFIEDNPPIERVVAVTTEPQFLLDVYFNLRCARPMPLYGTPGLIDHF